MQEHSIILMKKDLDGIIIGEVSNLDLDENIKYMYNIFLVQKAEGEFIKMQIGTERDLEDWEFTAVFDYFDDEGFEAKLEGLGIMNFSLDANEELFNPAWQIELPMIDDIDSLETLIRFILGEFNSQINKAYSEIADKKEEYVS